eukprot:4103725-Prymnesium_polylepis.1
MAVAGEWDTGARTDARMGQRTGMRSARAPAAICLSPLHGTPPNIHAIVTRSRTVYQMRAAKIWGAHVGAGGGGHTRRAGRWEQAQSDARIA